MKYCVLQATGKDYFQEDIIESDLMLRCCLLSASLDHLVDTATLTTMEVADRTGEVLSVEEVVFRIAK